MMFSYSPDSFQFVLWHHYDALMMPFFISAGIILHHNNIFAR